MLWMREFQFNRYKVKHKTNNQVANLLRNIYVFESIKKSFFLGFLVKQNNEKTIFVQFEYWLYVCEILVIIVFNEMVLVSFNFVKFR